MAAVILQGWGEISWALSRTSTSSWIVPVYEAWIPTIVYMWVAPFLFALLLFSFLNSRKKSDYYHALPIRREALFFSFAAAVYTWLIATALIALTLGTTLFAIAGADLAAASFTSALLIFIPSLLYAAALTMLAMSLSGTLFTNIVLGKLLLWMPLLVSALFREAIVILVPALPHGEESFFGLSLGITLFNDAPFDVLFGWGSDWTIGPVLNDALWTLFLALVMLIAALFVFMRRKSEVAGNSAPSNRMQAVYRIAVALPLLMAAAVMSPLDFLRRVNSSGSSVTGNELIFEIFAIVIVALILICTFELISTKTWRNLLKVPLSFGIALVLAAVFAGSVWAVASYEASFVPRPENITWISIPQDAGSNSSHMRLVESRDITRFNSQNPWRGDEVLAAIYSNEMRISDEELRYAIAEVLAEVRDGTEWISAIQRTEADLDFAEPIAPSSSTAGSSAIVGRPSTSSHSLTFEIRTSSGITKRRTLPYGEVKRINEWDPITEEYHFDRNVIIPNQLGEALEALELR